MSKLSATLLVGLLALAEGRSDDVNYLREADREDVLNEISPEMLDKIAYRLYAEDQEQLSAYERLIKDDKRKKMDYLNNIRPDLVVPQHRESPQEEEKAPVKHLDDHVQDSRMNDIEPVVPKMDDTLRRTEKTRQKLNQQREADESARQASLMEKERAERRLQRRKERIQWEQEDREYPEMLHRTPERNQMAPPKKAKAKAPSASRPVPIVLGTKPKTETGTPAKQATPSKQPTHTDEDAEQRIKDENLRRAQRRERKQKEQERIEEAEREKRIRDQLDEERKAEEERVKIEEERRKRRHSAKRRKLENAQKAEQMLADAAKKAGRDPLQEDQKKNQKNSILDRYNLHLKLETENAIVPKPNLDQDTEFKIEPRFKTEAEYSVSEEEAAEHSEELFYKMHSKETTPQIRREAELEKQEPTDLFSHGRDENEENDEQTAVLAQKMKEKASEKSSERSASFYSRSSSSSVSSISRPSSVSSESSLSSRGGSGSEYRGYHTMEEEILRYEEAQRHRQQMSSQTSEYYSEETPTTSEEHKSAAVSDHSYDAHESDHERQEALAYVHRQFEEEISDVKSDEEVYYKHYSRLNDEMKALAEEAERMKEEAKHDAEEADSRAQSAEQKAREAELRAQELETQAKEAEARVQELERQAKEADERVHRIEDEWARAERQSRLHLKNLRAAQRQAEIARQQKLDLEREAADREYQRFAEESLALEHERQRIFSDHHEYQDERYDDYYHYGEYHPYYDERERDRYLDYHQKERERVPRKETHFEPLVKQAPQRPKKPLVESKKQEGQHRPLQGDPKSASSQDQKRSQDKEAPKVIPVEKKPSDTPKIAEVPSHSDPTKIAKVPIEKKSMEFQKIERPEAPKHSDPTKMAGAPMHSDPRKITEVPFDREVSKPPMTTPTLQKPIVKKSEHRLNDEASDSRKIAKALVEDAPFVSPQLSSKDPQEAYQAQTWYPPTYTPPVIDDDPDIEAAYHRLLHPRAPMVEKHEKPIAPHAPTDEDFYQPTDLSRAHHFGGVDRDDEEWTDVHSRFYRTAPAIYLETNEVTGAALIEETQKEKALELFKETEERTLKEEYDTKISELTSDYKAKLRDLDSNYNDKKTDLDKERAALEQRAVPKKSKNKDKIVVEDESQMSIDPIDGRLRMSMPDPETQPTWTFDGEGIEDDVPTYLGQAIPTLQQAPTFAHNLASKRTNQLQHKTPLVDPLADIKRMQRDLNKEKAAREAELTADYNARLKEFQADYEKREHELEREKLKYQRRLIAERETEIADQDQENIRQKRALRVPDLKPVQEDDETEDYGSQSDSSNSELDDQYEENSYFLPKDTYGPTDKRDVMEMDWGGQEAVPKRGAPATPQKTAPGAPKAKKQKKGKSQKNMPFKHQPKNYIEEISEEPIVTQRHGFTQDGAEGQVDYGHDVYGQDYRYESFDLPQPVMPHLPVARIPRRAERPPHPLGGFYSSELLERQRLAEESHLYSYVPAQHYYGDDHYSNEMTAKTFPTVKPKSYNPEQLAMQLEKAHQAGKIAPPQEEVPIHGSAHRQQTKSFDLNPKEEAEFAAQESVHPQQTKGFDLTPKGDKGPNIKTGNIKSAPVGKKVLEEHPEMLHGPPHSQVSFSKQQVAKPPSEPVDKTDLPQTHTKKKTIKPQEQKAAPKTELEKKSDTKQETSQPVKQQKHFKEEREDLIRDLVPSVDMAKQAPKKTQQKPKQAPQKASFETPKGHNFELDFEKIALRRAAKQASFQKKFEEEHLDHFTKDVSADLKLTVQGEQKVQENPDQKKSMLDQAYKRAQAEYTTKVIKPKVEDFKIQFKGVQGKTGSQTEKATDQKSKASPAPKTTPQKPIASTFDAFKQVDFEKIAAKRAATQQEFAMQHVDEEHPEDVHGGRFQYGGDHMSEDRAQAGRIAHEQRKLEELGIGLDDFFDISHASEGIKQLLEKADAQASSKTQQESKIPSASPLAAKPLPAMPSYQESDQEGEEDSPLSLDAAKGIKLGKQFSLMDPVHPVLKDTHEALPVFDPSRVKQQSEPSHSQQPTQQPQKPIYVQQAIAQAQYGYFPQVQPQEHQMLEPGNMYQAPPVWYVQPDYQVPQQPPTYAPYQHPQYLGMPVYTTQTPITSHMYPTTPYMPQVIEAQHFGDVIPTGSLPYQPRKQDQVETVSETKSLSHSKRETQASGKQSTSMSSMPDITITRALNVQPRSVVDPAQVTPVKTLEQPKKNQIAQNHDDEPEIDTTSDTIHTYRGKEHPVMVTSTGPHSFVQHTDDEYIVGDGDEETLMDHVTTLYLDSRHDLAFARESNKYLQ